MESNTYTVNGREFELRHHGVKGMKWGVRKARQEYKNLAKAKGEYRHAKKAYNRSFSYAYNKSQAFTLSRARRAEQDAAWKDAERDAKRAENAKKAYKAKKKEIRQNAPVAAKAERGAKAVGVGLAAVGGMALIDHVYFGGAGAKAAKNAVTNAYNSLMDKKFDYSILDSAGKVIRRYN
jgi:hypothetical protein